jgi:hypothetical protein
MPGFEDFAVFSFMEVFFARFGREGPGSPDPDPCRTLINTVG